MPQSNYKKPGDPVPNDPNPGLTARMRKGREAAHHGMMKAGREIAMYGAAAVPVGIGGAAGAVVAVGVKRGIAAFAARESAKRFAGSGKSPFARVIPKTPKAAPKQIRNDPNVTRQQHQQKVQADKTAKRRAKTAKSDAERMEVWKRVRDHSRKQ